MVLTETCIEKLVDHNMENDQQDQRLGFLSMVQSIADDRDDKGNNSSEQKKTRIELRLQVQYIGMSQLTHLADGKIRFT